MPNSHCPLLVAIRRVAQLVTTDAELRRAWLAVIGDTVPPEPSDTHVRDGPVGGNDPPPSEPVPEQLDYHEPIAEPEGDHTEGITRPCRRRTPAPADDELPEYAARLRLKADACRWVAGRGSAGHDPRPRAEALDATLWMCRRPFAPPADPGAMVRLAGWFDATADAVELAAGLTDDAAGRNRAGEVFPLVAEAQAGLRAAVREVWPGGDYDQRRVFRWLWEASNSHRLFIRRHMREDDPPPADGAAAVREAAGRLRDQSDERLRLAHERVGLMDRLGVLTRQITDSPAASPEAWDEVQLLVDNLVGLRVPPSDLALRALIAPVLPRLPAGGERLPGFALCVREVAQAVAARHPIPTRPPADPGPSEHVRRAAGLLAGRAVLLLGGDPRPGHRDAIERAFRPSRVYWLGADRQSVAGFEPFVARPDVGVVVLAIRWVPHGYSDVRLFCDRHDKPLVRLTGGLNPDQIAAHILDQCSRRLETSAA